MSFLAAVLTLVLLAAVLVVISGPLRAARRPPQDARAAERAELRAAREAKYREIRDAEMDYRTGKLSRADYDAVDGTLRAEAVEILGRLEGLEGLEEDAQDDGDQSAPGGDERSVPGGGEQSGVQQSGVQGSTPDGGATTAS